MFTQPREECELKIIEQEKEVAVLPPKDACKCHKEDLARALNVRICLWECGICPWEGPGMQNQPLIDVQTHGVPNPSACCGMDPLLGWARGSPPSGKASVLGYILISDLRIF